jgi:hypothetical protein
MRAIYVAELAQPAEQCAGVWAPGLWPNQIGRRKGMAENTDPMNFARGLGVGGARDSEHCHRSGQEGTPVHSITWSARASNDGGIVSPSAFAVLRLMTNSNVVGCSTGRLAGLMPLRIRST